MKKKKTLSPKGESSTQAYLGLFWFHQGKVVLSYQQIPEEADRDNLSIDVEMGHYEYWESLRQTGKLTMSGLSQDLEYDDIKRGRVLYLFSKKNYVIYLWKNHDKSQRELIRTAFHLPETSLFVWDEHYGL